MDIPNLRERTVEKLRNATCLGTFDSYPEAEETASTNRPACITQGDEGWTVWRLDGQHKPSPDWSRILPAADALVQHDLPLWMQAKVDQHQTEMRIAFGRYGVTVDEHVAFVMVADQLAFAGQLAHALAVGVAPLPAVQSILAIVRGNLAALLEYVPAEARR